MQTLNERMKAGSEEQEEGTLLF